MANSFSTEQQYRAWVQEQASMKQEIVAQEYERRARLFGAQGAATYVGLGYAGNGSSGDTKPVPNKKVLLLCQS